MKLREYLTYSEVLANINWGYFICDKSIFLKGKMINSNLKIAVTPDHESGGWDSEEALY